MALTFTTLTSAGDSTDLTTYTTASVTATSGRVLLLATLSRHTTGASNQDVTSVSGLSATWTKQTSSPSAGTSVSRTSLWYGLSGTGSGTVSITHAAGVLGCTWCLLEVTGADTTTPIVQSINSVSTGGVTTLSLTLGAFGSVNNGTFGLFGWSIAEQGTAGTGFTKGPSTNPTEATPAGALLTEWQLSNNTTVAASWTTAATVTGVGAEIKAAGKVPYSTPYPQLLPQ